MKFVCLLKSPPGTVDMRVFPMGFYMIIKRLYFHCHESPHSPFSTFNDLNFNPRHHWPIRLRLGGVLSLSIFLLPSSDI